jgi:hypothetical protein
MRKALAAAVLSAAVMGMISPATSPAAGAADAAAQQPANAPSQIPVRQVVLFSSGVGYFEHYGTVHGDGSTELQFKSAQINDILKSLVLQDLDKGRVTAVTYPSQDPVAKTLRSFQVDINSNPSLHELLEQLRGAKVTIVSGAEKIGGTVLGVEKKQRQIDQPGGGGQVIDVWYLNLLTGEGGASIRSLPLDDVRDLVLEDPRLREELAKALTALAQARDQDKKPVTIHFSGQGDRRVRIGYVVETPVWKTSYRLLLSQPAAAGAGADLKDPKAPAEAALQGWAIVENQTDNDWNDVELSLVSGRPISFIQDLYQPLYIPRPVVQPELYASLRPQTYEGGMETDLKIDELRAASKGEKAKGMGAGEALRERAASDRGRGVAQNGAMALADAAVPEPINAAASVASVASAAKVGELFQYTVGSVTLPRQKSAMIPIVTDPVEVEKLSIYNAAVLPRNPLNGARVKNTTGKHLLQGPVTVLDGGTYAGDARIDDLPPGQERLLSYGIDQTILVNSTANKTDSSLTSGKIVKGILHLTFKDVFSQDYVAENKGEHDKTLVIEHPFRQGWKLVEPAKADETTDKLYRFKGAAPAGKATKLTVRQEHTRGEAIAILPMDGSAIEAYVKAGEISQPVKDALAKAAQLKAAMVDTQRQITERQQQIQQITAEQNRIRDNMKTVAEKSDYYNRLLKKLDEQETTLEKLQAEVQGLQKQADQERKALEDYLGGLNVG